MFDPMAILSKIFEVLRPKILFRLIAFLAIYYMIQAVFNDIICEMIKGTILRPHETSGCRASDSNLDEAIAFILMAIYIVIETFVYWIWGIITAPASDEKKMYRKLNKLDIIKQGILHTYAKRNDTVLEWDGNVDNIWGDLDILCDEGFLTEMQARGADNPKYEINIIAFKIVREKYQVKEIKEKVKRHAESQQREEAEEED